MRELGKSKAIAGLMLSLLLAGLVSTTLVTSVNAETGGSPSTVGLWHMDEIKPSGDTEITPDATGINNGIIGNYPQPPLVDGKFDKALRFNGSNFVYVPISFLVGFPPSAQPIYIPISPSLNIQGQIKIDAWVNVQGFTNATYNNIVVKCTRSDASWYNVSRVIGLAIRGAGTPEDGIAIPQGTLTGFVLTEAGVFNEVVTTLPVISLNQWTHVTFTRTITGMHLYVNGYEQVVKVIHGEQNPTGNIMNGTEIYFGHDSQVTIDEVSITDMYPEVVTASAIIDIGPNIMTAVVIVSLVFAIVWLLRRVIQMWVIHSRSS
jgi:hypothetical protein